MAICLGAVGIRAGYTDRLFGYLDCLGCPGAPRKAGPIRAAGAWREVGRVEFAQAVGLDFGAKGDL